MLKLNAGVSRKVGLPGFSSASASCTIEAELDSSLLADTEGFQLAVRRTFAACERAVADEITRLQSVKEPKDEPAPQEVDEIRTSPSITGASMNRLTAAQVANPPSPRPATVSQLRAIRAIAARRKIDLLGLLRERFGISTADDLGIRQASNLIDELKADDDASSAPSAPTNGHANGHGEYASNGGGR